MHFVWVRLILADEREAPVPGPNDRQITLAVKSYLEREHFLRKPIDDEIASRWFDTFLAALDPLKIYFLQSDNLLEHHYANLRHKKSSLMGQSLS